MSPGLQKHVASYYYNLGCEAATHTKTSSVKDIARSAGIFAAPMLPAVGSVGGIVGGGHLGFDLGADYAVKLLQGYENTLMGGAALPIVLGMPIAAAGASAGALLGGIGGYQLGSGARDVLKDVLRRGPRGGPYIG